ncbi:hypothetical protein PybrP1_003791 [[Pythium] brassicae (nom. inval.)]|nr:hypothetical protein PybrP1_003791 [[Pythium] brassicae (nom. inval.)]
MLSALSWKKCLENLRDGEGEQICLVMNKTVTSDIRTQVSLQGTENTSFCSSSTLDPDVLGPPGDFGSHEQASRAERSESRRVVASRGACYASRQHQTARSDQRIHARRAPPSLTDFDGSTRWNVEALLDHRDGDGRNPAPAGRHYRARWRGYPLASSTWESRSQLLEDVTDLVSDGTTKCLRGSSNDFRQLHSWVVDVNTRHAWIAGSAAPVVDVIGDGAVEACVVAGIIHPPIAVSERVRLVTLAVLPQVIDEQRRVGVIQTHEVVPRWHEAVRVDLVLLPLGRRQWKNRLM